MPHKVLKATDLRRVREYLNEAAANVAAGLAVLDRVEYGDASGKGPTRDQAFQMVGALRGARLRVSRVETAMRNHARTVEEGGAE